MSHVHNFSAGPCILPQEVLEQASQAVKSWDDHGLSLVEMSHRSKAFVAAMEECRALTKELLGLPDRFDILYLQGGASLAFLTSSMNFLPEGGQAAYADTGTWSAKAIKEAKHAGRMNVVTSSKEENYNPSLQQQLDCFSEEAQATFCSCACSPAKQTALSAKPN